MKNAVRMCAQELTWTTPLVPSTSTFVITDSPAPVCNMVPVAMNFNVLADMAVLVAMVVMFWPSVSAEETTVPDTTWYLRRLARTACREIRCLMLNC
jgi:hypothetical protein